MTSNQIRFASRHDWFIKANDDGSVTVLDVWVDTDGGGSQRLTFHDFQELYAWAGY